jgi:hypothetical protein
VPRGRSSERAVVWGSARGAALTAQPDRAAVCEVGLPGQPIAFGVQGAALCPSLAILRDPLLHRSACWLSHRPGPSGRRHRSGPETVAQVIEMLRRPLPEGPALASILERLEQVSLDGRLPEPRTQCETDLFDALNDHVLVATRRSPRTRRRSRRCWRCHVRSPGGLSRLHSYGSLLDRDAPGADV